MSGGRLLFYRKPGKSYGGSPLTRGKAGMPKKTTTKPGWIPA